MFTNELGEFLSPALVRGRNEEGDGSVRDAVARERCRIARELHDSVGHRLVLIAMRARNADRNASDVRDDLQAIEEIVSEALSDIRVIVGSLYEGVPADPPVDDRPLSSSIADIVSRIPSDVLSVSMETVGVERELPSSSRSVAIRVVEEGLTNAIKHAHRGNAAVILQYRGDDLAVVVRSASTRRRPVCPRGGGYGLMGLKERVASCGGVFEHHIGPSGEFTVRAALPQGDLPVSAR